jgi:hypothetical protein
MGKNRIWYVLLWLMLAAFFVPLLHTHYELCRVELRRFTWGLFFSPSAYTFFGAMFWTVFFPIKILLLIPVLFVDDQSNELYNKRYRFTVLGILAICLGELFFLTVMWGSFPLDVDRQNYVHLRFIPFVPWPDSDFLVFQ